MLPALLLVVSSLSSCCEHFAAAVTLWMPGVQHSLLALDDDVVGS